MANVFEVANFFIDSALKESASNFGDMITPLRLQKLLYFADAYYIAKTGQDLFPDDFIAKKFGPVIPAVYDKYSSFKRKPISKIDDKYDYSVFSEEEMNALIDTLMCYGDFSTSHLVSLSHVHGGPWDKTESEHVISKELIHSYFKDGKHLVQRKTPKISPQVVTGYRNDRGEIVFPQRFADGWD